MNLAFSDIFLDKITKYMIIFLPVSIILAGSLSLVILRLFTPGFRFNWLIGLIASLLALISTVFWQLRMPITFAAPTNQLSPIYLFSPKWMVDGYSWPYAVSLATLAFSVIATAVVRKLSNSLIWAGILMMTAIGLLAITSNNLLTFVILWVAIDLTELVILLILTKAEKSSEIVISFAFRMGSVFLLLWSGIINTSTGSVLGLREFPDSAGIYLLLAAGLRLGIIPLHIPIHELDLRRSIITVLRLVSAASGLALLSRIPITSLPSIYLPALILLTGVISIVSGFRWLVSKDELSGRPFWILSTGSLALSTAIFGNPMGSVALGSSLILCGGFLFLYSGRDKKYFWLPVLCIWSLSTLPFSLTAGVWFQESNRNFFLLIPTIIAQALLIAGFFWHAFSYPREVEIRSEPRWIQIIYPTGLSILPIMTILIGLWGWPGTQLNNYWWISVFTVGLASLFLFLWSKLGRKTIGIQIQNPSIKLSGLSDISWSIYRMSRQVIDQLSSVLEGDGGFLWSIVILVLLISLISQISK